MKLNALREKRAALIAKMRGRLDAAEAEARDLTAEEITLHDAEKATVDSLKAQIERLEGVEDLESEIEASLPAAGARNTRGIPRTPGGAGAKREFESLGEFMHAARFNPNDQRLSYVEGIGASENRAEQRMDDGASGGFALPVQFRAEVLAVDPMDAVFRNASMVIPAGSPPDAEMSMPALDQTAGKNIYGGVTMSWTGEGGLKPDTGLSLREIKLKPQELCGSIVITDKLLRNWQASNAFLTMQMRGAITGATETAFFQGDGVNKPLGILNAGCTIAVTRTTAGRIVYLDLIAMQATALSKGKYAWYVTRNVVAELRKLQDPDGRYIWVDNARDGTGALLLGDPVVLTDRIPTLGNRGDISYCAFENYLIKDGSGPFVAMSEHVLFQQNKTMIKAFLNVDGQPWLNKPIKRENGELQSPFVVLL